MVLCQERDTIQEEPGTWAFSNKPLTLKPRYHMHMDEGVGGISICILNWNVIVLCDIIMLVIVVVVLYHPVVNFHH